jgi:RNA polymerase sigma factor (sigma-70 family)
MKTNIALEPEMLSDASLVEHSLAGDHDAFGQIVARYQSPICALAYSACGNVGRSEDIAQEIFITAWRRLGSLQEPASLKAWLYGIARNLIYNTFRQRARDPLAGAESLQEELEPDSVTDEPDMQTISKEEETILWHVLSGLPMVYREPMVLFYRQNESVSRVADTLQISEEAVRQRLSRGRLLLNERLMRVVQNGLRRSSPRDAFAVAVVASLPILASATTAKGAIMGTATAEGATGQAPGLAAFFKSIAFFAGLIAIPAALGAVFGHKLGKDSLGLPEQRKSAAQFWRILGGVVTAFVFVPLLLTMGIAGSLHGDNRSHFLAVMTFWIGLAYLFVPASLVYWAWERRRRTNSGADTVHEPLPQANYKPGKISKRAIWLITAAAAGLLVFCYLDTGHNIRFVSPAGLRDVINQNAPGDLSASIEVYHARSIWGESSNILQSFTVMVQTDGGAARYSADVDDATKALLAQKGVACPTYIQGRDFEVLGMPGRLLPLMAAFVMGISGIFLLKRRREERLAAK